MAHGREQLSCWRNREVQGRDRKMYFFVVVCGKPKLM